MVLAHFSGVASWLGGERAERKGGGARCRLFGALWKGRARARAQPFRAHVRQTKRTEKVRARCCCCFAPPSRCSPHPAVPLPQPRAALFHPSSFPNNFSQTSSQCQRTSFSRVSPLSFQFPLNPVGTERGSEYSVLLGVCRATRFTHGGRRYGQAGRHGLGVRVRPVYRQHPRDQSGDHSLVQVRSVRVEERACTKHSLNNNKTNQTNKQTFFYSTRQSVSLLFKRKLVKVFIIFFG